MLKTRSLILIFFSVSLATASGQKVEHDHNGSVDFTKFKTYAWLAPGDSVLNRYRSDKLYGGYIAYAANKELTSRGLKLDSIRPDAIFVFFTSTQEITTYSQSATLSVGVGVAGPGYYAYGSAPVAGGKITAHTQDEGLMKYVMYDAETGKMIWNGMVEKKFKMSDDIQKLIGDYTVKIFKTYPVKPKK
jgi:hypothetical protein